MPSTTSSQPPSQNPALFREVLAQASGSGAELMVKLIGATRRSLSEREDKSRDLRERDQLVDSRKLLDQLASTLCAAYPAALDKAFSEVGKPEKAQAGAKAALAEVRFDELELMDEGQVDESVQMARSQQEVLLGAEAALADINALVCAAQGLKTVRAESNPIRPSAYVAAIQSCLTQAQVPTVIRLDWMRSMCAALGPELARLYGGLSEGLRTRGVVAAGYAVIRTAAPEPVRASKEAFLTLDKLRRLLAGELDGPMDAAPQHAPRSSQPVESFAQRFSREFEEGVDRGSQAGDRSGVRSSSARPLDGQDFQPTVPAAFEALTEMRQVQQVMKQIQDRKGGASVSLSAEPDDLEAVRQQLRQMARGLGQTLSLEVVALMLENIAGDKRLLDPIAQVVRSLEPPLLRLALVDPRFFSDKQHPARRLLHEITNRSLAFASQDSKGFSGFFGPLKEAIEPLAHQPIDNAEPFEFVLNTLTKAWDENTLRDKQQIEKAVAALRHAEDRNFLAERVAADIRARPDAALVNTDILNFLCSPWAQVVAQARLTDTTSSADPGQFLELISVLMWSAQPDLTRKNIPELTRLVPKLLTKLREGLDMIHYPSVKTSAFFEALMNLHQQAFKPAGKAADKVSDKAAVPADGPFFREMDSTKPQLLPDDNSDPWVAPVEAKLSGFMEMPVTLRQDLPQPAPDMLSLDELLNAAVPDIQADLPIGTWVELMVNGHWTRTQLSWASPQGTLFLFTSAFGSTQSMSLRSRNKMLANGTLRVISSQQLVEGALDAVAQTAMRNSMDGATALQ